MSFTSNLKSGVAGLALVAAVAPGVSVANDVPSSFPAVHPLLTPAVGNQYTPRLYKEIEQATIKAGLKNQAGLASLSAGGLVVDFEAALAKPLDRPQMVWFPTSKHLNGQGVPAGTFVVGAVVPPQALYPVVGTKNDADFKGNPAMCAYVNDVVLWKGVVNAINGTVTTDNSPNVTPAPGKSVCQPYLLAKGNEMIRAVSQLARNPPVGVSDTASSATK